MVAAVVGSGTSSSRPSSSASSMSFCIMLQSNQASSGISSTNGPRYFTIGEAITLFVSTSTASSRDDPALLGEQHALAEGQHLHGEAEVGGDLHEHGLAVAADVRDRRADVAQDRRRRARTPPLSPPTITDSLPCSSVITLPETGASSISAPRSRDALGELAARRRADRAHVDVDLAGPEPGEDPVGPVR